MSDVKVKSRLGRGLSSLISISAEIPADQPPHAAAAMLDIPAGAGVAPAQSAAPTVEIPNLAREIPLEQITPNPHQPRRTINPATLTELAASLKHTGLIQPIVVRKRENGFELIAGERRWRAAKEAGFQKIPAIVRDVDRFTQAQMALVENIQREDLNPLDRAAAYRAIMQQLNLTQAELALRLGEDRSSIANHLRLLELPESLRQFVKDGKLQLGHAKLLAGVTNAIEQERLANLVIAGDLSVRRLEALIREKPKASTTSPASNSAYMGELEKSLTRQLGLRVRVKQSAKKGVGRVILHYNTLDEFDRLMSQLGIKPQE